VAREIEAALANRRPTLVSVTMAQRAPKFQARAFAAELVNQTRRNFDRVTAISQFYGNGAHRPRIKAERAVSKFCRPFSYLKLVAKVGSEKATRPQDFWHCPAGGVAFSDPTFATNFKYENGRQNFDTARSAFYSWSNAHRFP